MLKGMWLIYILTLNVCMGMCAQQETIILMHITLSLQLWTRTHTHPTVMYTGHVQGEHLHLFDHRLLGTSRGHYNLQIFTLLGPYRISNKFIALCLLLTFLMISFRFQSAFFTRNSSLWMSS